MRIFTTIALLSVLGAQVSSAHPTVYTDTENYTDTADNYTDTANTVDDKPNVGKGLAVGFAWLAGLGIVGTAAVRIMKHRGKAKEIPVEHVDKITTKGLGDWFRRVGPKYGMA